MLRPTFLPTEATHVGSFSSRERRIAAQTERDMIVDSREFKGFDRDMRTNRGVL